jgi:NAD(P)-dependent dehydrogenase (short-subunit alcohol dehydrogenase family)
VLIDNAGVMAIQRLELTASGLETQFATNHVGHFALAMGLHGALAAAEQRARIVSVSSRGHLASPVVFEDINFESREYEEAGNPITLKSSEQGAATSVLLATSPDLEGVGGRYFEDCNEAEVLEPGREQGAEAGVAAYALDRGNADRLWELSLNLTDRG